MRTAAKQLMRAAILASLAVGLAACQTTPYRRTLPEWVQRVHVPMVVNETTEPGLEERFTDAVTRELLADGRLDVVAKSQADAVLRVTVRSYKTRTATFGSDDVEMNRQVDLLLVLALYDPSDPKTPFARAKAFDIPFRYYSDFRGLAALTESDASDRLSSVVGRAVVQRLMTGMEMTQP